MAPALIGLSGLWLPAPRIWIRSTASFLRGLVRRWTDRHTQASGNEHASDDIAKSAPDEADTAGSNDTNRWKSALHRVTERLIRYSEQHPSEAFSLAVFLCFLGHSFIWNPVIGFPADWDLFSFYQGPLHVFLYLRFFVREEPYLLLWLRRTALFTILPAFLWISHNAQLTRESQFHISQANRNLVQFLGLVQTESIFFRIPTLQRQRTYIEVRMFIVRAWNQVPYLRVPEQKKEELRQRLMQGLMRFQSLALQNKEVYEDQLPDVYYFLADLNAEISQLQKAK